MITIGIPISKTNEGLSLLLNSLQTAAKQISFVNYKVIVAEADLPILETKKIVESYKNVMSIYYYKVVEAKNKSTLINKIIIEYAKINTPEYTKDDILNILDPTVIVSDFYFAVALKFHADRPNNEAFVYQFDKDYYTEEQRPECISPTQIAPITLRMNGSSFNLQYLKDKNLKLDEQLEHYADSIFGMAFSESGGLLYIHPDATIIPTSKQTWENFVIKHQAIGSEEIIFRERYPEYALLYPVVDEARSAYEFKSMESLIDFKVNIFRNGLEKTVPELVPPVEEMNAYGNSIMSTIHQMHNVIPEASFDKSLIFIQSDKSEQTFWRMELPFIALRNYFTTCDITSVINPYITKYKIAYLNQPNPGTIGIIHLLSEKKIKTVMDIDFDPFNENAYLFDNNMLLKTLDMCSALVVSSPELLSKLKKKFNKPIFYFPTSVNRLITEGNLKPKNQDITVGVMGNAQQVLKFLIDKPHVKIYYIGNNPPAILQSTNTNVFIVPEGSVPITLHQLRYLQLDVLCMTATEDREAGLIYAKVGHSYPIFLPNGQALLSTFLEKGNEYIAAYPRPPVLNKYEELAEFLNLLQ